MRLVANPPNPFHESVIEWLDCAPETKTEVFEEQARSIISKNESPDVGFSHSVNAYRGCFHGCAYCYARPTHQYLDFGAGTDFQTKIVVKVNAPELLRHELRKSTFDGDGIVFSGVTDCYQPLEASYKLTRRCLEVCRDERVAAYIITKGALVRRDIDVLQELADGPGTKVNFSIPFADDPISKKIEPGAPRPSTRFRAMKELHEAGIRIGIGIAPVIPGLNDSDIPALLERAAECGAESAFMTLVRLPLEVKEVFLETINREFPSRSKKIISQIMDLKEGRLNRSEFGSRMVGDGARWEALEFLFESTCKKLGLNAGERPRTEPKQKKREQANQLGLFGTARPQGQ